MSLGGSILSINLNGVSYSVDSEKEAEVSLTTYNIESKSNGNGTKRFSKIRKLPFINGILVSCDENQFQTITDLAGLTENFSVSVDFVSGKTYSGVATIDGEFAWNTKEATTELNFTFVSLSLI